MSKDHAQGYKTMFDTRKMDTEYLKKQLGPCLSQCLSEVSMKRPTDPIEFIAQWLYKNIENVKHDQQAVQDATSLEQEKIDFEKEQERQEKMREEREKFAREEADRKKAESAAEAAGLPPVQEEAGVTVTVQEEPEEQAEQQQEQETAEPTQEPEQEEEQEEEKEAEQTEEAPAAQE